MNGNKASELNLKRFSQWIEKHPWKTYIAAAGAIWLVGYGFIQFVDSRARHAVTDEKFLTEIALKIRPTCVFNSRNSVLAESGTEGYLSGIDVKPLPEKYGFRISLGFNKHLQNEPILTCIDANINVEKAERGQMHDWIFEMIPSTKGQMYLTSEDLMNTNHVYRFKLEIIH